MFQICYCRIFLSPPEVASVGAFLRIFKCWEHLKAFETFENNFATLKQQISDDLHPPSGDAQNQPANKSHRDLVSTSAQYTYMRFLGDNRAPLVRQLTLAFMP